MIALQQVHFRQAPSAEAPRVVTMWRGGRGMPLTWIRSQPAQNGFIYAQRQELDYNQNPPKLMEQVEGWVPAVSVTRQQRRHYFQIGLKSADTPERWVVKGDHGQEWSLYWTPLDPRPQLLGWQNDWLAHVIDELHTNHSLT